MGNKERRDDFLQKAKEAEEKAKKAATETDKSAWLRIAAGYQTTSLPAKRGGQANVIGGAVSMPKKVMWPAQPGIQFNVS